MHAEVALNDVLLENLLAKGNSLVEVICVSVDSIPVGTRLTDDVPGNGDCGFAAVGRGSGHSALTLRQESNNVIRDNPLSFQEELIPESPADYTERMAKFAISGENGRTGEFCEGPSIAAMAIYLSSVIVVFEQRGREISLIRRTYTPKTLDVALSSIFIYYSFERQHYECIVPDIPTPPITPSTKEIPVALQVCDFLRCF